MTYNNFEFPQNLTPPNTPNYFIYDGTDLSLLHDGRHRYIILKSSKTGVTLKEANTSSSNHAYILGISNNIVYIVNPGTRQLIKLAINGQSIQETSLNLNDFNIYKDVSLTGTNLTRNEFIPQGGTVVNNTIVIGGVLTTPANINVEGTIINSDSLCYMLSTNNGSSFEGPYFAFSTGNTTYSGTIAAVGFFNDNWYFQVIKNEGSSFSNGIALVQTLRTHFSGDYLENHPVNTNSINNKYQLPFNISNNKIYFSSTDLNSYYTHELNSDLINNHSVNNLSNIVSTATEVLITSSSECNVISDPIVEQTGSNTFAHIKLLEVDYNIVIRSNKLFIEDKEGAPTYNLLGGNNLNSDYYSQPIEIIS